MYFIDQIKRQFLLTLANFQVTKLGENAGTPVVEPEQEDNSVLTDKQKARLEDLETLQRDLEAGKGGEDYLSKASTVLGNFIERVAKNEIPGYSTTDPEYLQLKMKWESYQKAYIDLYKENQQIAHIVDFRLNEIKGEITEQITEIQASLDKTEHTYTAEEVTQLGEQSETAKAKFRSVFFEKILGEADTGKALSEYIAHPKVQALLQRDSEGALYGYNIENILKEFDTIKEVTETDTQKKGESLSYNVEKYNSTQRDLDIVVRDSAKIEGEKTFGESRIDSTHEGYNKILENDAVKEALSSKNGVPLFEDLGMDHIKIMREKGVDLRQLFLVDAAGKTFNAEKFAAGDTFYISFSTNSDLADTMDFSFMDSSAETLSIDGVIATFDHQGRQGAGYYDTFGQRVFMKDGSEVQVSKLRTPVDEAAQKSINDAIGANVDHFSEISARDRLFAQSVYANPDEHLDTEVLPEGLAGMILAILMNAFGGRNFKLNPDTGLWEETKNNGEPGNPVTNREFREAYIGNMELGSLSAEFESGGKGPHAYVANDNGAGPSYGTYQMNTNKGVYKEFAARNGIAPGKEGWEAKITELGEAAFQKLEHDFIKEKNYDVMMNKITLPNKDKFSLAMQNVIWSIAVQHGPGNSSLLAIINNFGGTPGDKNSEAQLITQLYQRRGQIWSPGIDSRYRREQSNALAMLDAINSADIYNQNIAEIPGGIRSSPAEKNPSTGVTLCSKTARINLDKMGINNIKQGSSALASFKLYPPEKISQFPPVGPSEAKVADFYLDASSKNARFGHRVAAFQQNGSWFILDPYYAVPGYESNRNGPIRAEDYVNYMRAKNPPRKLWGAAYFS